MLVGDELPRFLVALRDSEQDFREFVLVLLHMGCRRGNAQRMRWSDLDLDAAIWLIPGREAKAKRSIVLPIPLPVLSMLAARRKRIAGEWVFPSSVKPGQPVSDLRSAWHTLCKRAKISGLTFHDLRRSLATLMATQGTPLLTIATLLGHSDPSTTARTYARLGIAALRAPLAAASSALLLPDPTEAQAMSASKNAVGG